MFMKKQGALRGTLYLIAARAAFVASGYAIHIGFGRLWGHSGCGIYAVIVSLIMIMILIIMIIMMMINMVLVTVMPQTASLEACCLWHDLCGVVKRSDGTLT